VRKNLKNFKKILVTGSDGFIGSHLVETLVRQGFDVKAFVNYNSFNSSGWLDYCAEDVKNNFETFFGDIRDPHGIQVAMKHCDTALHLAALIAIPFSYHSPDTYIDTNIKGTLNVLQAARSLGLQRLVHTSTSEVYGTAQFVPITEDHPLLGQSPYSATKIAADQLAYSFFASFDLPVVIARPFNTYGPRQSARAVIPTIITQIAQGYEKINLGAISPTRDFNYISDIVSGFISILKSDKGVGDTFNLGSNYEISIEDTVKTIAEIMDRKVEIISDEQRVRPKKSEVERLWASNTKARNVFGWDPEYSGLEGFQNGLKNTIQWFSQKKNLEKYKVNEYNL
jgi:NAD dependent epimerase/dehydratase